MGIREDLKKAMKLQNREIKEEMVLINYWVDTNYQVHSCSTHWDFCHKNKKDKEELIKDGWFRVAITKSEMTIDMAGSDFHKAQKVASAIARELGYSKLPKETMVSNSVEIWVADSEDFIDNGTSALRRYA